MVMGTYLGPCIGIAHILYGKTIGRIIQPLSDICKEWKESLGEERMTCESCKKDMRNLKVIYQHDGSHNIPFCEICCKKIKKDGTR